METEETRINSLHTLKLIAFTCFCASCLSLAICTHFLENSADYNWTFAFALIFARCFGIVSWVIGAILLFNKHWTSGTILFGGSTILPLLSLFLTGSL